MAKKIAVKAQTTTINEDVVYVDVAKLKNEVNNVASATKGINSSLTKISSILNKAISQKIVKGEKYRTIFKNAASHCNQQASGATKRLKGLQSKYAADVQVQEKNVLNGKIDELTKQVAKLQAQADESILDKAASAFSNGVDTIQQGAANAGAAISDGIETVQQATAAAGAAFMDTFNK